MAVKVFGAHVRFQDMHALSFAYTCMLQDSQLAASPITPSLQLSIFQPEDHLYKTFLHPDRVQLQLQRCGSAPLTALSSQCNKCQCLSHSASSYRQGFFFMIAIISLTHVASQYFFCKLMLQLNFNTVIVNDRLIWFIGVYPQGPMKGTVSSKAHFVPWTHI